MINKKNYEVWFLDYLEDRLTPAQRRQVEEFAERHPVLAAELYEMSPVYLPAEKISFPDKEFLKSHPRYGISKNDFLLIAELEGDLTEKEKEELAERLAQNPKLEKRKALYSLVKLDSETTLAFPAKSRLKQIPVRALRLQNALRLAAVFLLLLGLTLFLRKQNHPAIQEQNVVSTSHKTPLPQKRNLSVVPSASEEVTANVAPPKQESTSPIRREKSSYLRDVPVAVHEKVPDEVTAQNQTSGHPLPVQNEPAVNKSKTIAAIDPLPILHIAPQGKEDRWVSLPVYSFPNHGRRTIYDLSNPEKLIETAISLIKNESSSTINLPDNSIAQSDRQSPTGNTQERFKEFRLRIGKFEVRRKRYVR